jgi:hypothetical protein
VMPDTGVLQRVRRFVLAVLAIGLIGTAADLLLLAHYESFLQLVPLALVALALALIVWHLAAGGAASVRALQATMLLFLFAGVIGMVLHYRGNLEFQLEIDATQSAWDLFRKVVRAKAPPALAPASMAQLGLLGLVYCYRHPALGGEK